MLYLHIGLHKTGTSSIQASFFASRPALRGLGIDYFGRSENHSEPLLWAFSSNRMKHPVTVNARLSEKAVEEIEKDVKAQLKSFLQDRTCPNKLISGEEISNLKLEDLARLKAFLDESGQQVRVIVYVRNYFDHLSSQTQELVKWGWSIQRLSDEIKHGKLLNPAYRRRIEPSLKLFGRENVDIRVFHPSRFVGGDLLEDFCAALGAKSAFPILVKRRVNESLSDTSARALSQYNHLHPPRIKGAYNPERSENAKRFLVGYPGSKFVFDDADALAAYERNVEKDADFIGELLGPEIKALIVKRQPIAASAGTKPRFAPSLSPEPSNEPLMKSFGHALVELEGVEAINEIMVKLFIEKARDEATRDFVRNKLKFVRSDAMCRRLANSLYRVGLLGFAWLGIERALEIDPKSKANIDMKDEIKRKAEAVRDQRSAVAAG